MSIQIKYKSIEEVIKGEGASEAFDVWVAGFKALYYRKQQNIKNGILMEMAKKDPKFREAAAAELRKKGLSKAS
jgi:hypothetical protein